MLFRLSILLILVLEIASNKISAQDLMPLFGEPTRIWTDSYGGATNQDCSERETASHWIEGDTLIGVFMYQIIRSHIYWDQSYIMGGPGVCSATAEYPGLTAFVREDSNKVYRWQGEDHLIYDFNAAVGDSIPNISFFNSGVGSLYSYGYRKVDAVDSILVDGMYRKRLQLEILEGWTDTVYVIEGIGSTTGLFSQLQYGMGLSHSQSLICVREQGEIVYGEASCMLVTSIPEKQVRAISLHPNPTTGIINFSDQVNYEIFDATGRFIISGRSSTADLSSEPPGLYLIRISDGVGRSHHRVILER
jgi:hypothetical protein